MRKIIVLVGMVCLLSLIANPAMAWRRGAGWGEGDLKMDKNSIDGDATNGLAFDPDNDDTNEIIMGIDGSISATIKVTLDTTATIVLAATDCQGAVRVNNDNDVIDYTLPNAETGLSVVVQSMYAQVVTIDCYDSSEAIVLDGTTLTAGNAIDSPGTAGDYVLLVAISSTQWVAMGRSGAWVDGGAD